MAFTHDSAIVALAVPLVAAVGSALPLALAAACMSCAGSVPAGSSCDQSSDCESGLACLYALGSGCGVTKGQCLIPTSDCSGGGPGIVVCDCTGVALTCIPSSDALPQRSASGPACASDAGTMVADAAH